MQLLERDAVKVLRGLLATEQTDVPVSAFLRGMLELGYSRDEAVALLQREIAAGRIVLTDRFFLAITD